VKGYQTPESARARAEIEQLVTKAWNRTRPGIPLEDWRAMKNAEKRARRARKGKR
jgi:hypothetical protein